mmetsp:Transcript_48440/g.40971  ORF Transcript_48440/g.40971 Transcript_48440/m.40971 type:complete len:403 (+) Transcript_48440:385-1593(+)
MMSKQHEQETMIANLLKKLEKEKVQKGSTDKNTIGHIHQLEKQLKLAQTQNSVVKVGIQNKIKASALSKQSTIQSEKSRRPSNASPVKTSKDISKDNVQIKIDKNSTSPLRKKVPIVKSNSTKINDNDIFYETMQNKQLEYEQQVKTLINKLETEKINTGVDNTAQLVEMQAQLKLVMEQNDILKNEKNTQSNESNHDYIKDSIKNALYNNMTNKLQEQENRTIELVKQLEAQKLINTSLDKDNSYTDDKIADLMKQVQLTKDQNQLIQDNISNNKKVELSTIVESSNVEESLDNYKEVNLVSNNKNLIENEPSIIINSNKIDVKPINNNLISYESNNSNNIRKSTISDPKLPSNNNSIGGGVKMAKKNVENLNNEMKIIYSKLAEHEVKFDSILTLDDFNL